MAKVSKGRPPSRIVGSRAASSRGEGSRGEVWPETRVIVGGASPTTSDPTPVKSSRVEATHGSAAGGVGTAPRGAESARSSSIEGFTPEGLRELYRAILLPRIIEEKMLLL